MITLSCHNVLLVSTKKKTFLQNTISSLQSKIPPDNNKKINTIIIFFGSCAKKYKYVFFSFTTIIFFYTVVVNKTNKKYNKHLLFRFEFCIILISLSFFSIIISICQGHFVLQHYVRRDVSS